MCYSALQKEQKLKSYAVRDGIFILFIMPHSTTCKLPVKYPDNNEEMSHFVLSFGAKRKLSIFKGRSKREPRETIARCLYYLGQEREKVVLSNYRKQMTARTAYFHSKHWQLNALEETSSTL